MPNGDFVQPICRCGSKVMRSPLCPADLHQFVMGTRKRRRLARQLLSGFAHRRLKRGLLERG
jgi:hypothetical protein